MNRWKAALLGFACSLIAVGVWIFLSVVVGVIAGLAGALMVILFLLPYKKLNPEDKSNFPFIAGGIVIVAEVSLAELISVAIIASAENIDLSVLLKNSEILGAFLRDVAIGILLSAAVFIAYIFDTKRKQKAAAAQNATQTFLPKSASEPITTDSPESDSTSASFGEAAATADLPTNEEQK